MWQVGSNSDAYVKMGGEGSHNGLDTRSLQTVIVEGQDRMSQLSPFSGSRSITAGTLAGEDLRSNFIGDGIGGGSGNIFGFRFDFSVHPSNPPWDGGQGSSDEHDGHYMAMPSTPKEKARLGSSWRYGDLREEDNNSLSTPVTVASHNNNRKRESFPQSTDDNHGRISDDTLVGRIGAAFKSLTRSSGNRRRTGGEGRPGPFGMRYIHPPACSPFERKSPERQQQQEVSCPSTKEFDPERDDRADERVFAARAERQELVKGERCNGGLGTGDLSIEQQDYGINPQRQTLNSQAHVHGVGEMIDKGTGDGLNAGLVKGYHGDLAEKEGSLSSCLEGVDAGNGIKKVGLWELKAEGARLDLALARVKVDRDCELARVRELEGHLEQAQARLQALIKDTGMRVSLRGI
ncbi:unnamed protein product [Choristocarpus tenellus]